MTPTIAERLRRMIDAKGLTVSDVAKRADLHRQAVHRVISGAVENPGILTVERIAAAAGGTLEELLAGG